MTIQPGCNTVIEDFNFYYIPVPEIEELVLLRIRMLYKRKETK